MDQNNNDLGRILEALEQLRGDLGRLEERIGRLESRSALGEAVTSSGAKASRDDIDPETMMAIAAAVAAYLGKEPRIRSIRLLRSDTWPQEGRATLQAFHGNRRPLR